MSRRCSAPTQPIHTTYRRLVAKAFLPKRIREMTPHIDEVCGELIDGLIDAGECEFHMDFAMPLPGTIIAEELGLDRAEIHRFNRWASAMLAMAMRPLTEEQMLEAVETELEAQHHLAAEFERRRDDPQDDLISTLVHAHDGEDGAEPLTVAEFQNLMHQLVTGGFETTTSALEPRDVVAHPSSRRAGAVRADLSLVPMFVEEVLRYREPGRRAGAASDARRRGERCPDPGGLDGHGPLPGSQP